MFAADVQNQLLEHLKRNSGLEARRPYLGMSAIAQCPRKLYFDFLEGKTNPTERDHLYCYSGYLFERDVFARLAAIGIVNFYGPLNDPANPRGVEVVASFDERFRGHTDGETVDGELLEIKSVNPLGFDKVRSLQRPKYEHFVQVQAYMRYGPWTHALLVYVNRDTFEHLVLHVARSERHGEQLEQKARALLAAIDARTPPACECERCPKSK